MMDLFEAPWREDQRTSDKVLIKRGAWIDEKRAGRKVLFKIYYPSNAAEKRPVIIWSHGLGGTRDGAGFLARFLAHFGYILVHIQHHGTDSSLWEGKPGHPWDNIRAAKIPRKAALMRYQDVPFAVDSLQQGLGFEGELHDLMDFKNIGMSGHSFGAGTTQIMAGQMLGKRARRYSYKFDAFKAGIVYSPIPSYNRIDSAQDIYGDIDIPLFHMTGTEDESPLDASGYEGRLEIYHAVKKAAQHLFVLDGGDHMIYSGSRGQLAEHPDREWHERLIQVASLAFWDAYLMKDTAALEWLTHGGFEAYLGSDGEYEFTGAN